MRQSGRVLNLLLSVMVCSPATPAIGRAIVSNGFLQIETNDLPRGQTVSVATDLMRWTTDRMFLNEVSPGHYVGRIPSPWVPYVQYKLVVNGNDWHVDQDNSKTVPDGHGGENNVAVISDFQNDPWLTPRAGKPTWDHRIVKVADLFSPKSSRSLDVYSPPSTLSPASTPHYVTMYINDGGDYLNRTGLLTLIENFALDPSMPLITAVFISPVRRMTEYNASDDYARWLAQVVVPAVERSTGRVQKPRDRVLLGASMGGLAAFWTGVCASESRESFGVVLSQSGSLQIEDNDDRINTCIDDLDVATAPRIILGASMYETKELQNANDRVRDRLLNAGIAVDRRQYPGVHDWSTWQNELREMFTRSIKTVSPTIQKKN